MVTLRGPEKAILSYCGIVCGYTVHVCLKICCSKTCGFGTVCKYIRRYLLHTGNMRVFIICAPCPACVTQCSDDFICAQTLQIFGEELLALTDSREKRVTSSKQVTHTLPSHKLKLTLQGHSSTHMKNKHRFLWASVVKIALPYFFAETAKLIMATRVPTIMENLEISENLHWNISINYSVSFMCSFACWGSMIIKFHHKRMQLTFPIWVRFISELSVKNDFNYSNWF